MLSRRACFLGLPAAALAADWPQWRGPESAGVSEEKGLPLEWSAAKNIAWKTEIPGQGHSSPILRGGKVFLTTSIEGAVIPGAAAPKHKLNGEEFLHPSSIGADRSYQLLVLCLDAVSGKVLWQRTAHDGAVYDNRHKKGSYASPTPIAGDRHVYAYFGSQGLYAYDFDGKLAWKMSPGNLGSIGMGPGSSPAADGNLIFLQCDIEEGDSSFLVAIDKRTGREAWRVARKARASWVTPVIVRTGARTELLVSGAESIISYDPSTGKELWRSEGVEGNAIPSILVGHGMAIFSSGYPDKKAIAVKLSTREVVWRYAKGTAYVASPILYGDFVYLMTDKGLLTCLDAKAGTVKYEGARVPVPASFTASPVAMDGKLLLTSEDGDTFVIKAGPVHEVLRTNSLGEPVYASPAVAGGRIYIRGLRHLYCIRG
ncbi:MAG: PQQ-binding-like beta-propeller repeat protein [Bryobacteraceae bacterium]